MYPTLFHFRHLYLPTFGVLAALGLMVALALSERTARLAGADALKLWDAGVFAIVAAFLLSRVLLATTYWNNFRAFPLLLLTVPSLTAPGVSLTLVATAGWLWWKHVPYRRALDAWAPCAMVVWGFLALGHFAEGSDPGVPTRMPWGMPSMRGETVRLHPVALYVAVVSFGLALLAYGLLRSGLRSGATAGWTLAAAGTAQFLITFVRQPGAVLAGGLEALEWVALAMIAAGIALIVAAE